MAILKTYIRKLAEELESSKDTIYVQDFYKRNARNLPRYSPSKHNCLKMKWHLVKLYIYMCVYN